MKIDGVFSGGGVKSYAFMGALKKIEEQDLSFERVAGTSAGAIIASLIAAEYEVDEIEHILSSLSLKKLLDAPKITQYIPLSKWLFLYFRMGLNKGEKLEQWLYNQLASKGIYTFKDLQDGYLKVVVSDLSLGKLVVIPDDLERVYEIDPNYFPVSKAVRMSAGFPYFFMPKRLPNQSNEQSIIVDGGLLSNFPLWVFENDSGQSKRPILGVKLSGATGGHHPRKIKNAYEMFSALFSTMKQAHDTRYVSKSKQSNIIFIPVEDVNTMNFQIDDATKEKLIETGYESAEQFLAHWPT